MDNSEKLLKSKINNLDNYLQYCESLKNILEEAPLDNIKTRKKHIQELQVVQNDLEMVDLHIDFFDEMVGIVSELDSENKKIEKKIKKLIENN